MADIKNIVASLTSGISISGFESGIEPAVAAIAEKYFDEYKTDSAGNYFLIKHAKKDNYKKFLIDAHIDEVGMLVTQVLDGGFLKVTDVGGVDTRILQAAEVTVYGTEEIYGLVCSTPPHLAGGDKFILPTMDEIVIDTGYSKEYLEERVPVGTPVGYRYKFTELLNGKICTKGLDDKLCAASAVEAVDILSQTDFADELTLMLSVKEEISNIAVTGARKVDPDYAVVLDVCSARCPDSDKKKDVVIGGGCDISISSVTAPKLSKRLVRCAERYGIPHTVTVEASNTGTNANYIPLINSGVPTVLISVPLRNMHTYSEVGAISDARHAGKLTAEFILELSREV